MTVNLKTNTNLGEEKVKLLGIFVRRMFNAKSELKSGWKGKSYLGIGNSIIATLNDVFEHDVETLKKDLTHLEKANLSKNQHVTEIA